MTKKQLFELKEKLNNLKTVVDLKNLIINDYEAQLNDPDYLKQRLDELGKVILTTEGDGSAFNPFKYWSEGMEVHTGEWWLTEDGYLWEAKKDGIPASSSDAEYWDVIE